MAAVAAPRAQAAAGAAAAPRAPARPGRRQRGNNGAAALPVERILSLESSAPTTSALVVPMPSAVDPAAVTHPADVPPRPEELSVWLYRFFALYDATQLPVIDRWAENWKGREAELRHELVAHHGPPCPATVPAEELLGAVSPAALQQQHQLQQHGGGKASKKGARPAPAPEDGQLASAAAAAESGAGAPPPPPGDPRPRVLACRSLLIAFLAFYAPERLPLVDAILLEWDGQEAALLERLRNQASARDYILNYYHQRWPERAHEAVFLAKEWLGVEGHLIKLLPKAPLGPPCFRLDPARRVSSATARGRSLREQVHQFFKVYQRDRLHEADVLLAAYEGSEDVLVATLRRQFLGDTDVSAVADRAFFKPEIKAAFRVLCAHWNPGAADDLEELFWQFHGTEEEFILSMCTLGEQAGGAGGGGGGEGAEGKRIGQAAHPPGPGRRPQSPPQARIAAAGATAAGTAPLAQEKAAGSPPPRPLAVAAVLEPLVESAPESAPQPAAAAPEAEERGGSSFYLDPNEGAAPRASGSRRGAPPPPPPSQIFGRGATGARAAAVVAPPVATESPAPRAPAPAAATYTLPQALVRVGAGQLIAVCGREDITTVRMFASLSPQEVASMGVRDPALMGAPARVAKLLRGEPV